MLPFLNWYIDKVYDKRQKKNLATQCFCVEIFIESWDWLRSVSLLRIEIKWVFHRNDSLSTPFRWHQVASMRSKIIAGQWTWTAIAINRCLSVSFLFERNERHGPLLHEYSKFDPIECCWTTWLRVFSPFVCFYFYFFAASFAIFSYKMSFRADFPVGGTARVENWCGAHRECTADSTSCIKAWTKRVYF